MKAKIVLYNDGYSCLLIGIACEEAFSVKVKKFGVNERLALSPD